MTSGEKQARDESVQFSLKELLKLEDERLDEQARAAKAAAAAAEAARKEAAAHKQREEEARRTEEATRAESVRRAELEAVARREAMEKAILEQSRLEVDIRARAEERELERRHEIELARLRLEGKKGSLASLAGSALLGGGVALLVGLGIHFGVTRPAHARQIADLERSVTTAESRATEEGKRADQQQWNVEGLEKQNAALRAQLDELRRARITAPSGGIPVRPPPSGHLPPAPSTQARPETPCLPGDPLCPTITSPRR